MDTTLVIQTYGGTDGIQVPAFSFKDDRVVQCEIGPSGGWRTLTLVDGSRTRVTLQEIRALSDAGREAMRAVFREPPDRSRAEVGFTPSPLSDPELAVDHVRRVARETADSAGFHTAALAVMEVRRDYRIMPLALKEASPEQVAVWRAVRLETRSLVPMAMGAHGGNSKDAAFLRARVTTPAAEPLPSQPEWAPDPLIGLQAAALHSPSTSRPSHPGDRSESAGLPTRSPSPPAH